MPTSNSRTSLSSPTATPPSGSPTTGPRARPAVTAYLAYTRAVYVSERHPPAATNDPYPKNGDFTKYAFDPARSAEAGFVLDLTQGGVAYRGVPPAPRVKVQSVNTAAKPYPTVTLIDCPTRSTTWTAYYKATGTTIPAKIGKAKPPYLLTVQVIYYENHWGVYKMAANTSKTCTA